MKYYPVSLNDLAISLTVFARVSIFSSMLSSLSSRLLFISSTDSDFVSMALSSPISGQNYLRLRLLWFNVFIITPQLQNKAISYPHSYAKHMSNVVQPLNFLTFLFQL